MYLSVVQSINCALWNKQKSQVSEIWENVMNFLKILHVFCSPFFSLVSFLGTYNLQGHIHFFFHTSIRILINSSSGWNIFNPCGLWDLTKQRQSFHHGSSPNSHRHSENKTTSTIPIWYKYAKCFIPCKQFYHIEKYRPLTLYMYIYNHSYQKVG